MLPDDRPGGQAGPSEPAASGVTDRSTRAPAPGPTADEADRELEEIAAIHGTEHVPSRVATHDLANRLRPGGPAFWGAVVVLAALAAAGIASLVGLVASGPEP